MTNLYHNYETGLRLVKLNGPLLRSQTNEVINTFKSLLRQGAQGVIVDLSDVPIIDSLGLATLLAGYRLFGGQPHNFWLVAPQAQPQLLFNLTGFDHIFQVCATLAEAMADEVAAPALQWRSPGYALPALDLASVAQPALPA